MNLSLKIARRYFFSRSGKGGFNVITVISGISLLGYVVGAAALVIVLSVFNGFEALFASLYTNFDSDIRITAASGKVIDSTKVNWATFSNVDGVECYSQVVEEHVLLRYQNQQSIATLKGVDQNYVNVTHFDSNITSGFADVRHDSNYAIVGQGLAYRLSIDPNDVFKPLVIYVPQRDVQSALNPQDAFNKALIVPGGVFSVQEEVDNKYVICPIHFAQDLLSRQQAITAIEVRLRPGFTMDKVKEELGKSLGDGYVLKNRFEQRESFFKVMRSEKTISYIILLFILLIAASNTISSLYILVMEKGRDLQVLRSMGLTAPQAAGIFRFEGMLIALAGGSIGIVIGVVLCYLQQQYGFVALQGSVDVMFSAYPVELELSDIGLVFVTVLGLGYITTLYPSKKARQALGV